MFPDQCHKLRSVQSGRWYAARRRCIHPACCVWLGSIIAAEFPRSLRGKLLFPLSQIMPSLWQWPSPIRRGSNHTFEIRSSGVCAAVLAAFSRAADGAKFTLSKDKTSAQHHTTPCRGALNISWAALAEALFLLFLSFLLTWWDLVGEALCLRQHITALCTFPPRGHLCCLLFS